MDTFVLEINLISAQGLKVPSANLRRMHTYALAWTDPSTKLRTRVDRVGGENPTWNDKFLFRVTPEFLSSDTSGVSVEIYAVGYVVDHLIGSVRFLISSFLPGGAESAATTATKTPSFTALQIRRPSGRFHGVLNIGAMVIDGCDLAAMKGVSAIGYRDLMGESVLRRRQNHLRKSKSMAEDFSGGSYSENSCAESGDYSDGTDSTTSAPSTPSTAMKEWNGIREMTGKNRMRSSSDGGGLLSCFWMQRKIRLNPCDRGL